MADAWGEEGADEQGARVMTGYFGFCAGDPWYGPERESEVDAKADCAAHVAEVPDHEGLCRVMSQGV